MALAEYGMSGSELSVTDEMLTDFKQQGYILVRGFLSREEVAKARQVFDETDIISRYSYGIPDRSGRMPRMVLWNQPGDDVTGMICRCDKVVGTCEALLGGEVYHYHSKMVMKEPLIGGKQEWHQDYGYWYNNGLMTPQALSVFVPLDKCTEANGCLQIITGSHACGRIEHKLVAGQTAADLDRVAEILQHKDRFQLVPVLMEAGDALFFHSNVLHYSEPNNSEDVRRVLIMAYNRADNTARSKELAGHHPVYTQIHRVRNSAILQCLNLSDFTGKEFLRPEDDKTVNFEKS